MRRKTIRRTACALLFLLLVFGGVAVLRHTDRRLPLDPIVAAQAITAAEHAGGEATTSVSDETTTASAQDEPTTRTGSAQTPNAANVEPVTAFSRGSAAVIGADVPDGAPQLRSDGDRVGTGLAGDTGSVAVTASDVPAFAAETTTAAAVETPQTDRPSTPEPEPVILPAEPTTEAERREPVIVTDLTDCLKTQSELTNGALRFFAYLEGDTDGCSLRVRLTRADGSRELLQPGAADYLAPLPLGVHHITMTIVRDGEAVSYRDYTVEIVADKATDDHPQVGDEPPVIQTNLDDWTEEIVNSRFTFRVTARTAQGAPISADGVEVRMDGSRIYDPTGSRTLEYALFFAAPNVGESETHTVTILVWDGQGNSAFRSYTIVYRHVSDGDRTGEVTVILDATTVGLGVLDAQTLEMRQGENAAQLLLRVLDDFGYTYDAAGSDQIGFYLRRIARDGMCDGAQVPDALWTMILRDGLRTTAQHDRDSLGEHDYTQGSGWMFSVNDTLFPGKGLERTFLDPGDTLRVCFTLSYGKDVGGFDGSGAGMGSLAGYCGIWRDGAYSPLGHHWSEPDENGTVICTVCRAIRKEEEDG